VQEFVRDVEQRVVGIWSLELGCPVAATDDFFKLGGDSIMVLRIMYHLKEAFGREFVPSLLFQHSVAGEFSRVVADVMLADSC
jgi:acyl carrier protein